ncbi:MAG: hypothetical protein IKN71_00585 [Alphaproteobacteria bacterium]|nr:hypothetical protein [Alphaproteobacteria bacterium]
MQETPIIVISSAIPNVGKTTLALNLAAALWSDNYKVKLFAPHNAKVRYFLEQRENLRRQTGVELPLPELIEQIENNDEPAEKTVIIADIPTSENEKYAAVFAKAHTLITVAGNAADLHWPLTHPYVSLIWEAKKNIAARGIKYLNWIAVLNQINGEGADSTSQLQDAVKRFGFRVAEPLHYRQAFQYIENGYCAADMAKFRKLFKMSMSDVYARREILTLTDFLWQK